MADKIKIRRGLAADLPQLDSGEFGWSTDTEELWIGNPDGYSGGNVLLNALSSAGGDVTVDGYVNPGLDNTYGLGTPSKRWSSLSVGPGSIHLHSTAVETGTPYSWRLTVDSNGQLTFAQSVEEFIKINPGTDGTITFPFGLLNIAESTSAPATPPSGFGAFYYDSSTKQLRVVDDTGTEQAVGGVQSVNGYTGVVVLNGTDLPDYGIASGVATLDASGRVPNSQVPPLAITETFVVASEAAMLGLTGAEEGDVAIRTDVSKSFILSADGYEILANWKELLQPGAADALGLPTDGSFDGYAGISASDTIVDGVDKLDEFLIVLANEVAPPPGSLLNEDLAPSVSVYSAKLSAGLSDSWVDAAGTTVTGLITTGTYDLNTPDSSTRFLAGTVGQGQASAGTLTHVFNGVDGDVHDVAASGVGITGVMRATALVAHNAVFQRLNAQVDGYTQDEGKTTHAIRHSQSGQTDTLALYYDDVNSAPSFSSGTSHTVDTETTKYLSGIQYYISPTDFDVDFTAASGIFRKAYHPVRVAQLTMVGGGASAVDLNPGDTGITPTDPPGVNDTMTATNVTFAISGGGAINNNPSIRTTLRKPDGTSVTSDDALARKISLNSDQSTSTTDNYTDEAERLVLSTATPWTSSSALTNGNLQVFNGTLVHGNDGDYAGFTGDQAYERMIAKTAASGGTLTHTGTTLTSFGTGSVNIVLQLETDALWFDLGLDAGFVNGSGDGSTPSNSIGARISGGTNSTVFSFGIYSTGTNNNEYRVRVVYRATGPSMSFLGGT